jgi:hypothetical protein
MHFAFEILQLCATALAAGFFLKAALGKVHYDTDRLVEGMRNAAKWNARASIAGAVMFACQAALFFIPATS